MTYKPSKLCHTGWFFVCKSSCDLCHPR